MTNCVVLKVCPYNIAHVKELCVLKTFIYDYTNYLVIIHVS